jgi:hypothetical protein
VFARPPVERLERRLELPRLGRAATGRRERAPQPLALRGAPPTDGQEVEVIADSFAFAP